jgi:hypothetical protein
MIGDSFQMEKENVESVILHQRGRGTRCLWLELSHESLKELY